jgi:tetratricopeptide (TPR) repeat protein
MGEVAFNRGNLKQADGLYRQAMAGTAEAVRRSPDDAKRLFDHAQNVFWVGEVARFAGRPAEAEAAWRNYQRIANRMAALEPDNVKYRMEVLYANEDVGISLYYQHRFADALREFEGSAGPMEKLASLYPANTTYQKEFGTLVAWIADAQRSQGNYASAIAARERQISGLEQMLSSAADSDARSNLISAHEGLGVALAETGQTDRAVKELQAAVSEAEDLIPIEPRNAQWKNVAAAAQLMLAQALLAQGQRDSAAGQTEAGCKLAAGLPASYAGKKSGLGMSCAMLRARLALAAGATPLAMSYANQALASTRAQHSEDPISDRYAVAAMYMLLGDIRLRAGDSSGAKSAWATGLAQLPAGVTERPVEMNERAELLKRLGRSQESAELAKRLKAIGYRRPI